MRAMVEWVRSRVDPPAPYVTDTKFGVSGASRLMVSHRLRSISSVLGGKNSKEIFGECCSARWPSKAGGVTSVMALTKAPQKMDRHQAWRPSAKISQTRLAKQPITGGK